MGWEYARVCVCMRACVEPGPHSFEGCTEQTLCTQMHQFPVAAEWFSWLKRERRKHTLHSSPGLEPRYLAQSEWKSLKSRFVLINVGKPSAQMGFDQPGGVCSGCFHYQRKRYRERFVWSGWGMWPRHQSKGLVITHCLSPWAFTDTQKIGGQQWPLPHITGCHPIVPNKKIDIGRGGWAETGLHWWNTQEVAGPVQDKTSWVEAHHRPAFTLILKMRKLSATEVKKKQTNHSLEL